MGLSWLFPARLCAFACTFLQPLIHGRGEELASVWFCFNRTQLILLDRLRSFMHRGLKCCPH